MYIPVMHITQDTDIFLSMRHSISNSFVLEFEASVLLKHR